MSKPGFEKHEFSSVRVITLKNIPFAQYDPSTETLKFDVHAAVVSNEDAKVLEKLFPNTFKIIDKAFTVEALFNSLED